MRVTMLSVGRKDPSWLAQGFAEYTKRLPPHFKFEHICLPPGKHSGGNIKKSVADEGDRLLQHIKANDWVVALDERGKSHSSVVLADKIDAWSSHGEHVVFVIGGVDGLADAVTTRSNERLSLSPLTFPHHLVRLILIEAIYRAWSISAGHPYHRD